MRVKYYSANDLTTGINLKRAEEVLYCVEWDCPIEDINDALELYNIWQLFESGCRLKEWDDDRWGRLQEITNNIPERIGRYCSTIMDDNFSQVYLSCDSLYHGEFVSVIEKYSVFKRISESEFSNLLNYSSVNLRAILEHKKIVRKYSNSLADFIKKHRAGAELILSYFFAKEQGHAPIYIPDTLTNKDIIEIITNYINSDEPNTNYLALASQGNVDGNLSLPDDIRYMAQKRYEERIRDLFSSDNHSNMRFGAEVNIADVDEDAFDASDPLVPRITYSGKWIDDNQDYPTLLNNLKHVFCLVDYQNRATFFSRQSYITAVEGVIGVKGKAEYDTGVVFEQRQITILLSICAYCRKLTSLGIEIENVIEWFFNTYIPGEFGIKGFSFTASTEGTTFKEKCRNIACEMDSVIKQFTLLVEKGEINRERLAFTSAPEKYESIPSLIPEKYAYLQDEELNQIAKVFFSDQSLFTYTERTKDKYSSLAMMLRGESLTLDDFFEYQRSGIKQLIDMGFIEISSEGCLMLNTERIALLDDFYHNECVCPRYYKNHDYLQLLINKKKVTTESTLLSEQESSYIDYIFNRRKFSNGLDLRNRYIHGTNNEKDNELDYYRFLLIMLLLVIKINEELCFKDDETRQTQCKI